MNGNTIKDGRRGLEYEYNFLDLLSKVKVGSTVNAIYSWGSDGLKRGVKSGDSKIGFEYLGSLVYKRTNGVLSLESADFGSGRILKSTSGYDVNYFITDHLGSVRAVVNQSGSVISGSQSDYYPFGERYSTLGNATTTRYQFNGKEKQEVGNVNLLDYGARMYDTKLGRWLTHDPLAEKYSGLSPYNYCANNPVINIDPDGRDWYSNSGGGVMWRSSVSESFQDNDGVVWNNIGSTYLHYREDGSAMYFYSNLDSEGNQYLSSRSFSRGQMAVLGMNHSIAALMAALDNIVKPSSSNSFKYILEELKAQWTDPMLLASMASISAAGLTRSSAAVNNGARNAANASRLAKQLASEEQMTAVGIEVPLNGNLRVATYLAKQYGGAAGDWVKMTSESKYINGTQFEIHWYKNNTTGQSVEYKTKFNKLNHKNLAK